MCADVSDLQFYGTFSDKEHTYFHFELLACEEELLHEIPGYENEKCFTQAQVKMWHARHLIVGLTTNSFVDSTDFVDPIKTLDDYLFMEQLDET